MFQASTAEQFERERGHLEGKELRDGMLVLCVQLDQNIKCCRQITRFDSDDMHGKCEKSEEQVNWCQADGDRLAHQVASPFMESCPEGL